ncbi:MAG: queuosine precursor transporter [Planctomycetes bacterium]|nr:queuosine precursor transporter [Planctomycetota bacterium]MCB9904547.1 queuosine precursor transporter [Planctomycetota bacterium]MCB9906069.1 queuosine precursor transporter [Planctomycetota bacterium]
MTESQPQPVAVPHAGRMTRADATYTVLASTFAVVLVLTNIIGTKLFALFPDGGPAWINGGAPITLTAGIVTYPLTFCLTDIVSEIWGRRRADLMVMLGFGMSLLMLGIVQLGVVLPPSEFWTLGVRGIDEPLEMQSAFAATFHNPRILLFASMLAYLVAQLFDVRLYHFWWRVTKGRHMWVRNNGSTIISQLVDTIIVNGIFLRWGLSLEWATIGEVILWVYLCKVVLALLDTPLLYLGRSALRRFLGLEADHAPTSAPLA